MAHEIAALKFLLSNPHEKRHALLNPGSLRVYLHVFPMRGMENLCSHE